MDDLFEDLAQGIHDRAKKRRQVIPGTDIPYLKGGRDSQDYSYGGQFGIPNSPEALDQQIFYNEQTYPGMAGVRGIGETLNSIVDKEKELIADSPKDYTGISWLDRNPLLDEGEQGTGVAEFFVGEGGDFFETLGNSQETTGMQQLDAGMLAVDALSLGTTKMARKGAQGLYDTLDGTYINKGFDKLEEIGSNIAEVGGNALEAGKSGAMVLGKSVDDALSATFNLPPGGSSPQLATANDSVENLLKSIEKPKPTRQEPLQADIYLDDKGNNVITGSNVVAPRVIQDFGIAIDDAVKSKEQELGRELTEDETRDVYDQVTVDKFNSIEDREKILGRKDAVLRQNGEGRIVLDTLDDYEVKDLSPVLPRADRKGSVMNNDFKGRRIGDDTWSEKTQGDGRTDIKWEDAFEKSNLAEQIGEENVGKLNIKQLMPRVPKRIAESNNKREVSQWFQKIYDIRNSEKGGAMQTFATPEARAQRRYQQRSMIPNAIIDMYKKDPNSFKFTDDEVAEEMNNYLSRGVIAMVDNMNTLQNRLADLPDASAKKVMDLLEKQARGRLVRNKISKHLDNNLDLVPKTDIPEQSNIITNDLQINGMSIGDIIRGAKETQEETLRQLTLQAQKKLEDSGMLGEVYSAYRKKMGMTPAQWAKTSPGEKFRVVQDLIVQNEQAVKWGDSKYSHLYTGKKFDKDHPLYEVGEIYTKMSDEIDDAVINAGKGLNPDGTPGKITVNQDTVIHEGAGHHNQDLSKANPGGSRKSYEKEVEDISDLLRHLDGNFEGKGRMQVSPRASSMIGYEDYLGMKGEVGARKTADNALSGNRTLDNLAEPKSAVDYKQPQTLDKDGNWVDTTTRSQKTGYNWGLREDTPIKNNLSRLDYQDQAQVDKILKYLNFTEEMGINNPKTLDNWLEQENKALLTRIKRDLNVADLKLPESRVDLGRASENAIKYDAEGKEILKPKDGITNEFIKSISDEQAKLEGKASSAYRAGQGMTDDPSVTLSSKKPSLEELDDPNAQKRWQGENTAEGNPTYDASKSEVKNWDRNKSTKDGQDKDLAGTFNDANVKQRDINPVANIESLVSRIQNPTYLKHIKRARSAKDDYQATDDELITNLVRSLSEIENNVVTGNNKARQLKAKDNTIDYINRVILDIQNRPQYRKNSGAKKEYQPKTYDDRKLKGISDNDKPMPESSITPGYEFTETGGLLKPAEVDLSQHIGDEIIPMPYDATSRGNQLNKVNDLDLDVVTHGGDEHMDAVNNIEAKIAGASSKSIVDKIVKRIKSAGLRSERRGGTGQVLIATNTMGDMSEGFAKAPAMTAIQVVSQGKVGARKKFNTEFRNMSSSKAGLTDGKTGKKKYGPTPFKNLPDVTSKEFEDIMLGKTEYKVKVDGVEKVMTPSHIRKALWKEMSLVKNQTAFHYAWDDLQKAQLRAHDIEKGFMGNRIAVVKDPKAIKAIENKDPLTKEIYDSAFNGERLGTLDIGAQPIEKLMPERYKQAYERWKKRYPNSSPSSLRNMAIGQLEKATKDAEVFSETITPGLIDNIYKKK